MKFPPRMLGFGTDSTSLSCELAVSSSEPLLTTRAHGLECSAVLRVGRAIRHRAVGICRALRRDLLTRPPGNAAALDGIRAIAILLVVGFHSKGLLPGGWIGVDLFFALSGFLIGQIIFTEQRARGLDFAAFYIRRVFRIFPAYYTVLTLSVLRSVVRARRMQGGPSWNTVIWQSLPSYLCTSNYVYGSGWVAENQMAWAWSLCIEAHFYLLAPIILALLFGRARRSRCVGVAGLVVLVFVPPILRLAAYMHDPWITVWNRLYPESQTHCDGLWYGVLVAYAYVYHHDLVKRWVVRCRWVLWPLGVVCIGLVSIRWGLWEMGVVPVVLQFQVLAVGASLIILNGLFVDNGLSRFLSHRAWYPVARLSYGIFLVHPFVVYWLATDAYTGLPLGAFWFGCVVLAVSSVVATLLFVTIEKPMLDHGRRLGRRV
jgi:peptidoglycan/LPS O-acetylase OafA/YrhL